MSIDQNSVYGFFDDYQRSVSCPADLTLFWYSATQQLNAEEVRILDCLIVAAAATATDSSKYL